MKREWEVDPAGEYIGDIQGEDIEVLVQAGSAGTRDLWLMAASPELLKACEMALGAFNTMNRTPETSDAVDAILGAMAKARGDDWKKEYQA